MTESPSFALPVKKTSSSSLLTHDRLLLINHGYISYYSTTPAGFVGTVRSLELLSEGGTLPKWTIAVSDVGDIKVDGKKIFMKVRKNGLMSAEKLSALMEGQSNQFQPNETDSRNSLVSQQSSKHDYAFGVSINEAPQGRLSQFDRNSLIITPSDNPDYQEWTFKCKNPQLASSFVKQAVICQDNPDFTPNLASFLEGYKQARRKNKDYKPNGDSLSRNSLGKQRNNLSKEPNNLSKERQNNKSPFQSRKLETSPMSENVTWLKPPEQTQVNLQGRVSLLQNTSKEKQSHVSPTVPLYINLEPLPIKSPTNFSLIDPTYTLKHETVQGQTNNRKVSQMNVKLAPSIYTKGGVRDPSNRSLTSQNQSLNSSTISSKRASPAIPSTPRSIRSAKDSGQLMTKSLGPAASKILGQSDQRGSPNNLPNLQPASPLPHFDRLEAIIKGAIKQIFRYDRGVEKDSQVKDEPTLRKVVSQNEAEKQQTNSNRQKPSNRIQKQEQTYQSHQNLNLTYLGPRKEQREKEVPKLQDIVNKDNQCKTDDTQLGLLTSIDASQIIQESRQYEEDDETDLMETLSVGLGRQKGYQSVLEKPLKAPMANINQVKAPMANSNQVKAPIPIASAKKEKPSSTNQHSSGISINNIIPFFEGKSSKSNEQPLALQYILGSQYTAYKWNNDENSIKSPPKFNTQQAVPSISLSLDQTDFNFVKESQIRAHQLASESKQPHSNEHLNDHSNENSKEHSNEFRQQDERWQPPTPLPNTSLHSYRTKPNFGLQMSSKCLVNVQQIEIITPNKIQFKDQHISVPQLAIIWPHSEQSQLTNQPSSIESERWWQNWDGHQYITTDTHEEGAMSYLMDDSANAWRKNREYNMNGFVEDTLKSMTDTWKNQSIWQIVTPQAHQDQFEEANLQDDNSWVMPQPLQKELTVDENMKDIRNEQIINQNEKDNNTTEKTYSEITTHPKQQQQIENKLQQSQVSQNKLQEYQQSYQRQQLPNSIVSVKLDTNSNAINQQSNQVQIIAQKWNKKNQNESQQMQEIQTNRQIGQNQERQQIKMGDNLFNSFLIDNIASKGQNYTSQMNNQVNKSDKCVNQTTQVELKQISQIIINKNIEPIRPSIPQEYCQSNQEPQNIENQPFLPSDRIHKNISQTQLPICQTLNGENIMELNSQKNTQQESTIPLRLDQNMTRKQASLLPIQPQTAQPIQLLITSQMVEQINPNEKVKIKKPFPKRPLNKNKSRLKDEKSLLNLKVEVSENKTQQQLVGIQGLLNDQILKKSYMLQDIVENIGLIKSQLMPVMSHSNENTINELNQYKQQASPLALTNSQKTILQFDNKSKIHGSLNAPGQSNQPMLIESTLTPIIKPEPVCFDYPKQLAAINRPIFKSSIMREMHAMVINSQTQSQSTDSKAKQTVAHSSNINNPTNQNNEIDSSLNTISKFNSNNVVNLPPLQFNPNTSHSKPTFHNNPQTISTNFHSHHLQILDQLQEQASEIVQVSPQQSVQSHALSELSYILSPVLTPHRKFTRQETQIEIDTIDAISGKLDMGKKFMELGWENGREFQLQQTQQQLQQKHTNLIQMQRAQNQNVFDEKIQINQNHKKERQQINLNIEIQRQQIEISQQFFQNDEHRSKPKPNQNGKSQKNQYSHLIQQNQSIQLLNPPIKQNTFLNSPQLNNNSHEEQRSNFKVNLIKSKYQSTPKHQMSLTLPQSIGKIIEEIQRNRLEELQKQQTQEEIGRVNKWGNHIQEKPKKNEEIAANRNYVNMDIDNNTSLQQYSQSPNEQINLNRTDEVSLTIESLINAINSWSKNDKVQQSHFQQPSNSLPYQPSHSFLPFQGSSHKSNHYYKPYGDKKNNLFKSKGYFSKHIANKSNKQQFKHNKQPISKQYSEIQSQESKIPKTVRNYQSYTNQIIKKHLLDELALIEISPINSNYPNRWISAKWPQIGQVVIGYQFHKNLNVKSKNSIDYSNESIQHPLLSNCLTYDSLFWAYHELYLLLKPLNDRLTVADCFFMDYMGYYVILIITDPATSTNVQSGNVNRSQVQNSLSNNNSNADWSVNSLTPIQHRLSVNQCRIIDKWLACLNGNIFGNDSFSNPNRQESLLSYEKDTIIEKQSSQTVLGALNEPLMVQTESATSHSLLRTDISHIFLPTQNISNNESSAQSNLANSNNQLADLGEAAQVWSPTLNASESKRILIKSAFPSQRGLPSHLPYSPSTPGISLITASPRMNFERPVSSIAQLNPYTTWNQAQTSRSSSKLQLSQLIREINTASKDPKANIEQSNDESSRLNANIDYRRGRIGFQVAISPKAPYKLFLLASDVYYRNIVNISMRKRNNKPNESQVLAESRDKGLQRSSSLAQSSRLLLRNASSIRNLAFQITSIVGNQLYQRPLLQGKGNTSPESSSKDTQKDLSLSKLQRTSKQVPYMLKQANKPIIKYNNPINAVNFLHFSDRWKQQIRRQCQQWMQERLQSLKVLSTDSNNALKTYRLNQFPTINQLSKFLAQKIEAYCRTDVTEKGQSKYVVDPLMVCDQICSFFGCERTSQLKPQWQILRAGDINSMRHHFSRLLSSPTGPIKELPASTSRQTPIQISHPLQYDLQGGPDNNIRLQYEMDSYRPSTPVDDQEVRWPKGNTRRIKLKRGRSLELF